MNTFNFQENKIEVLSLETLQRTYKENDVYGNPQKGIYHFSVINQIADICRAKNMTFEIEEIFATNNKSAQFPGVSILPQVEERLGVGAVEAHILRRVYTTINIFDGADEELTTNIAIAFHQDGVQVAFGPTVKICHNLCIMGADRTFSNYGKNKVSNDEIFKSVENWISDFGNYREADTRVIREMKKIPCSKDDVFKIIGMLTAIRVGYDNNIGNIRTNFNAYPLNQSQISQFTEDYLRFEQTNSNITLWHIYNLATELYKPGTTDIPNIIPQSVALMETLKENYNLF